MDVEREIIKNSNYFKLIKFRNCKINPIIDIKIKIHKDIKDFINNYITTKKICGEMKSFQTPYKEIIKNEDDIRNAVLELRKLWNIDSKCFPNVLETIDDLGIIVAKCETLLKIDAIGGFIDNSLPLIVLNSIRNTGFCRFGALRELAFFIFNFSKELDDGQREKLSNIFAEEMLLPDNIFISLIGEKRRIIYMEEFKIIEKQFGIPLEIIIKKAFRHNFISRVKYEQICDTLEKKCDSYSDKECLPHL